MTKKKPQIPLNEIMAAIDKKDRGWYSRLSDEQKKVFSPWLMMRYASSVQGPLAAEYLYFVNMLVNQNFMDINKHPELQWLLFTAAGQGKTQRHVYVKPPNTRKKKNKVYEFFAELYPLMKSGDLELMLSLNSTDELKDFARNTGIDDNTIKEIFK